MNPNSSNQSLIRIPDSADEFKPLRKGDLNTECVLFLQSHWDDVKDFYKRIAGEVPMVEGSPEMEEARCVFHIQEIAQSNGFALIGTTNAARLKKAFRYALKNRTTARMHLLIRQNKQLRLESPEAVAARKAQEAEARATRSAEYKERLERLRAERPEREAREARERAERAARRAQEAAERAKQMELPDTIRVRG